MEDLTDNERAEQLRRWWSENWLWILGGIALGLAALGGYQYWQNSRLRGSEQDQAAYRAVIESLQKNERDAAYAKATQLRDLHPKSVYADHAELVVARSAVENNLLDDAVKRLRSVTERSQDPQVRGIARSRLARVLIEQGKYDAALSELDLAKAGDFLPLFAEVRGDALVAKGDPAGARREYDAALAAKATHPSIDRDYVQMKRDALPSSTASPGSAKP